jgi:hypothetical protein
MRDCPHCKIAVDGIECPKCGYTDQPPTTNAAPKPLRRLTEAPETEEWRLFMDWYRQQPCRYGPLSAQQRYNVARFFPSAARRVRELATIAVDPENPLHATSRMGPLMRMPRGRQTAAAPIEEDIPW